MNENAARDPHTEALVTLANAMFRYAAWPSLGVGVLGVVVFGLINGVPGLVGAVIGAVLAIGSSLLTLFLMRKTAAAGPHMAMAASFGGFVLKLIVLLLIMIGLGEVTGLHRESLGITMVAVVIVAAAAEAVAFRRTRLPTLVIPGDGPPEDK